MKKEWNPGHKWLPQKQKKAFRIMKLTFLFSVCFAMSLSATTLAQQRVSMQLGETKLKKVFEEIQRQTNHVLVYSDDQLRLNGKVTANFEDATVEDVLGEVLQGMGMTFRFENDYIVITRGEEQMLPQTPESVKVSGTVKDKDGHALPGVTVLIKGTQIGVATDVEGKFSLNVPDTQSLTLVFSMVGMKTQEVSPSDTENVVVVMEEETSYINEVIVQGYGTTRVKDATGAVSRMNEQDIAMAPMGASVQSLLQGRAPGVNVTIQSASPTSPVNVVIRGVSTLTGNTQPLWVIDGVPDYSMSSSGDINNALFNLNLSDIESIDILKDVSATAIYGSRAANGVIIVTTKRGKEGMEPTVDLNLKVGVQTINSNKINTLNAEEYKYFVDVVGRQTIELNGGFDYNTRFFFDENKFNQLMTSQWDGSMLELKEDAFEYGNTDWWDEMTQNALTQQYDLSIRGGTERSNYFISFSYNDQKGVVKGGRSKLYTGRLNFETSIGKQLKFGINLSASSRKTNNKDNLLENIVNFRPDYPAYNEDGSLNLIPTNTAIENPNLTLANRNNGLGRIFAATASIEWEMLEGLLFKTQGTVNYSNYQTDVFNKKGTRGYSRASNNRTLSNNDNNTYVWENTLTWSKTWEKHNLVALLGHSVEQYRSKSLSAFGEDFPDEHVLINLQSGAESSSESAETRNSLVSLMARLNYKFNNRYLATFTFRADGSSRFGADNRWGYFPSGALAWIISEENFMENVRAYIPYLKLRVSVGKTGSQNLGDYDYISLMSSGNYEGAAGIRPSTLGNPILKWEETISTDVGLDFGLWDERIRGTLGYYNKTINNLIYNGSVAANTSFTEVNQNIGTISNTGWEFDIKADVLKTNDMQLTLGFNIATNHGKVKKLDGFLKELKIPYYYEYVHLEEGGEIGEWYGYKYAGRLFQNKEEIIALRPVEDGVQGNYRSQYDSAGDLYLMDMNGDKKITADDKVNLGNFNPKCFGGFTLSYSWKNLYASAVFSYSCGAKRLLYYQFEKSYNLSASNNVYNSLLDSYNFAGANASYPRLSYTTASYQGTVCDLFIHDASYLRLNALNLNYRLPKKWYSGTFVDNIELSFAASNLFTITKYPGFDPQGNFSTTESSYDAGDVITVGQGIDKSIYPSARVYNIGLRFTFK